MPDALLDVVKEEQTRAREAGKSARGGPHTGGVGRGVLHVYRPCNYALIGLSGRSGAPQRGLPFFPLLLFVVTHSHIPSFSTGRGGARGGPPRGGRARGRGM